MRWLSDRTVEHLRRAADLPDVSGTKYRIVEELARGGMGTVYLAEDSELDRRVALKVLQVTDASGEATERMLREARILARLEHPGIVPIHDVGTLTDGRVFYAMKLVQGTTLAARGREPVALPEILRLFQRICEAVAFAHSHGVIHRDLKPENIMTGSFGEVLIMDWGVAKLVGGPDEIAHASGGAGKPDGTADGVIIGTPAYMAPEQARGETDLIDERTDVYGLGAILRFLLQGPARVPRPLAAVCAKAMAGAREDRYSSAREMATEVERFLDGAPLLAYRENIAERSVRLFRRYRMPILLVAAYLVMRVALLFFSGR